MEGEEQEILVRQMRDGRRSGTAVAIFVIAAGAFLVLRQSGHAPLDTRVFGAVLMLMGAASLPWIWHRDWSPLDAERYARHVETLRKLGLVMRGGELLMLLLALFGLLFPAEFGEYWKKHQFLIILLVAGLLSDVITRVVRWRAAQIADSELP